MRKFLGKVRVGLRDLESGELISVYPKELEGEDKEIEALVKTWYYEQGCHESELVANKYFVDNLNEVELKNHFGDHKQ